MQSKIKLYAKYQDFLITFVVMPLAVILFHI